MTLVSFTTPQLPHLHSGKVRESFRVDASRRLLVTTDRVSAFDQVLATPIPDKGAVLNGLSAFWFTHTADIVPNHFLEVVDPQASLVREVTPIRVEMVVRGYLTGSMWRAYAQGKRRFSGVEVPDCLARHSPFPDPILTPTTKEESDREITPQEIIASGLVSAPLYEEMEEASRALFKAGTDLLAARGILLVDTKYEFGILEDRLLLIDELHTPDSSRFWLADSWERDPLNPHNLDKEFIRSYLLSLPSREGPISLPDHIVAEAASRYREIYERIVGVPPESSSVPPEVRLVHNLVAHGVMRDGFVVIVMGSPRDREHCARIASLLEPYGLFVETRVVSAHRNPEDIAAVLAPYGGATEPGVILAVAGLSNGLGGALAGSTTLPVINCPPFRDTVDLLANVNSSLMMPPGVPACTVVTPETAAAAAVRCLNLPRLRRVVRGELEATKAALREADAALNRRRGA